MVRHGHDPVRAIQTGIGLIEVQKPKARDRAAASGERIRFTSNILPEWARRTKSLDALLPVLYLRGVSAGDFQEAPRRLARQGRAQPFRGGDRAPQERMGGRISAMAEARFVGAPIRLRLGGRRLFADAHGAAGRMHAGADGRDAGGQEGADRLSDGHAGERAKLEGAARRFEGARPVVAPQVAIGDGALGFWKALDEAFPTTRHQRCWLHKTLNVLDKLPKSMQPNAHKDLREIWLSPNRGAAEAAMTTFAEKYAPKYDKAVECLIKDRQTLLMFFDLPADHWDHLRTSNPIESVFATVKHRTVRMKGALSQDSARLMVFKLVMAASTTWRRLQGQNQLPKVVNGIQFKDEIEAVAEIKSAARFTQSPTFPHSSKSTALAISSAGDPLEGMQPRDEGRAPWPLVSPCRRPTGS